MPAVNGYLGTIRSNNSVLTTSRWSLDWRTDVFDVSNFQDLLAQGHYVTGLKDADVTAECYYDTADDPFNLGFRSLVAGLTVRMRLSLDTTSLVHSLMFDLPAVLLASVRMDTPVRDVIRYTVTGRMTHWRASTAARNEPLITSTHA